jgi:hypothetical protein
LKKNAQKKTCQARGTSFGGLARQSLKNISGPSNISIYSLKPQKVGFTASSKNMILFQPKIRFLRYSKKNGIIIDKNARVLSKIFSCYKSKQNPKKFLYGV